MKRFFVLCAALLAVVACNDSTGPGAVSSIQAVFPTSPLPIGNTFQLDPRALDKKGNPSTADCVFTYSSSDPSVATVTQTGLITGVANGNTTISIETHGKVVSAQISVGSGGGPGSVLTSLTVYPPTATVAIGQSANMVAVALDINGNVVPTTPAPAPSPNGISAIQIAAASEVIAPVQIQWTSSASNIATVNNSGVVTGLAEGTTTLTAIADGRTATATVTIVGANQAIESVKITPTDVTLGVNSVTPLTAVAYNSDDEILTGRVFTWSSSNTNVATVDRDGVVRGVAVGNAVITAISAGKSATANVIVSSSGQGSISLVTRNISVAVGGTSTVSAVIRNSSGAVIGGTVNFTSADPSKATITNSGGVTGTVTGVSLGNTTFTATSGGLSTTGSITVSAAVVTTVEITPSTASIQVQQTQQFTAVAKDGSGNVIPGRTATWSSSNSAVVAVSGTGAALGTSVGNATITGTIDGISATVPVSVTPRIVTSISIAPTDSFTLATGQHRQLVAKAYDASGNEIVGTAFTYSSSNTGFAIVANTGDLVQPPGVVTGVAPGRAVITVTAAGKSATVVVNVTLVQASNINILPQAACVPIGQTVQLVGQVLDAAGGILTGRPIQWALQNPLLGSLSSTGLFKALETGTYIVTATVDGVVRTAQVTVCAATASSVSVTPSSVSLRPAGTQQLTVVVLDAIGNAIPAAPVTYSSSAVGVATVNNSGLVTAIGVGTATITVTSGTKSATATIVVSNAPVSNIVVTPGAVTLQQTETQQLSPVLLDAQGNPLTGRTVTYSSGNTAIATVSSTGLVTGVGAGITNISVTSEGVTKTVQVTVSLTPIASVTLTGTSLVVGLLKYVSPQEFVITPKDAAGNVLEGRSCTLVSSNPNVLRVGTEGLTALSAGTVRLRANCGGVLSNEHAVIVVALLF